MKQPRSLIKTLLWTAAATTLVAMLAAGAITNITLRSIERNLPNLLLEQLHDLTSILEDLSEVVRCAEMMKAAPSSEHFVRLREKVTAIHTAIREMRNTYVFDNLIQASAFHAVVAPAVADIEVWLSEGISGHAPETNITIEIVLARISQAFHKAKVLTDDSRKAAGSILNEQRRRLDQFLFGVNLLFALASVIALITILSLLRQHVLQLRELEAQAERRRVQEQLLESESTLKSLFRAAPVGIGLVSNRVLMQVNDRLCEMLAYSREELTGNSARLLYQNQEEFERVGKEKYDQINRLGTGTVETRWLRKDGAIIDVLLSSTPLAPDDLSAGVTFTALDITDRKRNEAALIQDIAARKQVEEALRKSEERFSLAMEATKDGLWDWNLSTNEVYYSPGYLAMLGYTSEEVPAHIESWRDLIHPEDKDAALKANMDCIENRCDGFEVEFRMQEKGGQWRWILGRGKAVSRDKSGRAVRVIGTHTDITERKRAEEERERLRGQLVQAQKMESIGRLAGGVAHDFNNMLSVILGHSELALNKVDADQPLFVHLQEIQIASERSADLIRQLLAFARKQTVAPRILDLNDTVEGMLKMLRRLIGEDIDLAWLPGKEVWQVKMDPAQIDQILANLCINARDAIAGFGKITIETRNIAVDASYCAKQPGFMQGEYVLLAISDNGSGIDRKILDKLFEPFFTTKELGKGTGLGLATVYGIVKQNNGFIDVYSEPGKGTTFKIYMPRYGGKAEQIRNENPVEQVARGHETILLIEDEPVILDMIKMMLEHQGYIVLAAATPAEAIRMAEAHTGEVHLVLTDVVMPEMNGRDLAKRLLSLYPKAKRMFMSGYTTNVIAHHGVLDEGIHFIQKPFLEKDLTSKLREVLKEYGD